MLWFKDLQNWNSKKSFKFSDGQRISFFKYWFLLNILKTVLTLTTFSNNRFHTCISPQHFPLYRQTEASCSGVDAPPPAEKQSRNREKWEVVSKEMSNKLLSLIRPRLVLSGHTHHGCYLVHKDGTPEITIPSFSWRNRNNPSFVLVSGSSGIYELGDQLTPKCCIPCAS